MSKLEDIRAAVEQYKFYSDVKSSLSNEEWAFFASGWTNYVGKKLPDLLAIAAAAGELQTILDDLDYGVRYQNSRRKLKDALAKFEGE